MSRVYKHASAVIDDPEPPQLRNMPRLSALSEPSAAVTLVGGVQVVAGGWRDGCGGEVRDGALFSAVHGPRVRGTKSRCCGLLRCFLFDYSMFPVYRLITNPRA